MSRILNLPFELIQLIVECLQSKHDINALIQTCSFFYHAFDGYLYRYDLEYCSRSALKWAARRGFDTVAAKSLAAGQYTEEVSELDGSTPLLLAARYGNVNIVKRLLSLGNRVKLEAWNWWSGRTALAEAVASGEAEIARLLLEKGASVDITDRDHCSPLLLAVENGHDEVVKVLLGYGATVNARGKHYQTPLSSAAERGHWKCVDLLLKHGAMVDSQDRYGKTGLIHAVKNGHATTVKRLLEAGADPNKGPSGIGGLTPLHQAALDSDEAVVGLLLGAGADPKNHRRPGHLPAHFTDSMETGAMAPS
ncbi:ankyrin repeat-containing domain protein [Aspergillus granulosus]|uniref:Ankyrin repeat-containing domain protein n=1 Tax=Aspergillus granulosus TaxID=176169 RepID=A0ABR4I151_9EURO